jgi:hypothetical protein
MRKLTLILLATGLALGLAVGVHAFAFGGKKKVKADVLTGYQEATPAGVSSTGAGTFKATIDEDASTISYELTYSDLEAAPTQAHIHFGNRFDSGGISVFLCTNLGNGPAGRPTPACPADSTNSGTVTGTLTPADVTAGAASQGIAAGEFEELVRAIRAGVTYANVHTTKFPMGEVRAQINDPDQHQVR